MPLRLLASLVAPPLCAACGASAGRVEPLCQACRGALRWLDAEPVAAGPVLAWAPLAYDGGARALVRALKFHGAVGVAATMAAQMAAAAPPDWLATGALVPVPLHPARRRRRGYNQAERLAAALSARTGLAVFDCLERSGPRATQVGRGRTERLEAIGQSVRAAAPPPAAAILVDDVITTGTTLAASASALLAAGCREVSAVAYARTPGR